jgi:hypothetical protein
VSGAPIGDTDRSTREGVMWARVARFDGAPEDIDARIERVRGLFASGELPPDLAEAKFLMLVNHTSGEALGVTLFASEEAMMKGDAQMNTGAGHAGKRTGVEFYEVPVHTL